MTRPGWHKYWQPRYCQEGARTHRKVPFLDLSYLYNRELPKPSQLQQQRAILCSSYAIILLLFLFLLCYFKSESEIFCQNIARHQDFHSSALIFDKGASTLPGTIVYIVHYIYYIVYLYIYLYTTIQPKSGHSYSLIYIFYRMGFFGAAQGCGERGGGGAIRPPSLKSVTHILQWWNLAELYLI